MHSVVVANSTNSEDVMEGEEVDIPDEAGAV